MLATVKRDGVREEMTATCERFVDVWIFTFLNINAWHCHPQVLSNNLCHRQQLASGEILTGCTGLLKREILISAVRGSPISYPPLDLDLVEDAVGYEDNLKLSGSDSFPRLPDQIRGLYLFKQL